MTHTPAAILHPRLDALFRTWQQGGDDEARFAEFADHMVIIEVSGSQYSYRHYGRSFVDAFRVDLTGLVIDYVPEEMLPTEQRLFLEFEYAWVHQQQKPVWRFYTARFDGVDTTWQRLILPLSSELLLVGAVRNSPDTPRPTNDHERLLAQVLDAVPVWLDADGQIGGLVICFRDLTESRSRERELEQLATIDPLTGVHNRRHFERLVVTELERAVRFDRPLSLMMLDIDHFKRINDTYGHAAGDDALRRFADACRTTLRRHDVLGRIGGEEFALLLPDTDSHGAPILAERLRRRIAGVRVPVGERGPVSFTVSIGCACSVPSDSLPELFARADHALYAAKRGGRNRVVTAPTPQRE